MPLFRDMVLLFVTVTVLTFRTDGQAVAGMTDDGTSTFDIDANWNVCWRNSVNFTMDGKDDYGAIFNSTLRHLSANGGGNILLGPGEYPITAPIELPANTCIIGAGPDKTVLRVIDNSWPWYPFKGVLFTHKETHVSLVGFTLDGNRANQNKKHPYYSYGRTGIYQERAHFSLLLNVHSVNHNGNGIDLHGSDGNLAHHILVTGVTSMNNSKDGIRLDQTMHVTVTTSIFSQNHRHPISASKLASNVKIRNTQMIGSLQRPSHSCGAYFAGSGVGNYTVDNILIMESVIRNVKHGLCLRDVSNVTAASTSIINVGDANSSCYVIRNAANFVIANNYCYTKSRIQFTTTQNTSREAEHGSGPSEGCPNSIGFLDVCCPMACGFCGGVGCGDRSEGKVADSACCYWKNKQSAPMCETSGAPCVLPKLGI